ncbi:MAG: toll/interleukin-1 receptor domain-containing protein [Verrucomicrobiota bacterium]
MSAEAFTHDVFLSHSAKDKAVVRPLAERLRQDGLKVWFDEWVLKPGDSIPAKIEEGLERSQFTFQPSAFILQPFLDAPIKGSLAQFLCFNWLQDDREKEYSSLLEACCSRTKPVELASSLGFLPPEPTRNHTEFSVVGVLTQR